MTKNEFRSILGMKPSDDPKADELINSNINHPDEGLLNEDEMMPEDEESMETEDVEETDETSEDTVDEQALLDRIKKLGG